MIISICNLECLRWFPLSSHPWCSSSVTWCCSLGLLGLCSINQSASQVCGTKNPQTSSSVFCCSLLRVWENIKSIIWNLWYRHPPTVLRNEDLLEKNTNNVFFSKCYFTSSQIILLLNNSLWPLEDNFSGQCLSLHMYKNIWAILQIIQTTVLEWGCTICINLLNEILLLTTLTDTCNHTRYHTGI